MRSPSPASNSEFEPYYTPKQISAMLGGAFSEDWLHRHLREVPGVFLKRCPPRRPGTSSYDVIRVPKSVLRRWLDSHTVAKSHAERRDRAQKAVR